MRVLLVVQSCLEGLLEDSHHIGSICCRYKLKWALNLFDELIATTHGLFLHVNFVCDADAGNVGDLVAHLAVPLAHVLVRHLTSHVEHHDADVCSEVIRRVQVVE